MMTTGSVCVNAKLTIFWIELVRSIVESTLFEVLCFLSTFLLSKTFSNTELFCLEKNKTEDFAHYFYSATDATNAVLELREKE